MQVDCKVILSGALDKDNSLCDIEYHCFVHINEG